MSQKDQAGGDEPAGGDFVSRLVSDPANPPRTTLLSGYVGASDEEGHTRIYFDPQLSDYVDVASDDVLHTEPSGRAGPLSPTLVWIRRDAQVLHGQAGSTRQRAGFFEGRVWRENFGVTAAARPGAHGPRRMHGPPAPGLLSARPCPSVAGCRTPVHPCAAPEGSAGEGDAAGEGGEDAGLQGPGGAAADMAAHGSGGGPGILPSEWCPSAGLPCPPRTLGCPPPPTFRCPPTYGCPPPSAPYCPPPPTAVMCRTRAPFCPDLSAVDACPTRFCPPG